MKKFHTGEVVTGMPAHFTKNLLPFFFHLIKVSLKQLTFKGNIQISQVIMEASRMGENIHVYTNINAFR